MIEQPDTELNQPCAHGKSPVTCRRCLNAAIDETVVLAALEEQLEGAES